MDAREERIVEPAQMEKKDRFAKEKGEEQKKTRRTDERTTRREKEEEREGGRWWYVKETYVPTQTPQDASWPGRASGPPMPRS